MSFQHGRKAIFKLDTLGDVLTDISQYLDHIEFNQESAMTDVAGINSTYADFIPALITARFSMTGKLDGTLLAQLQALIAQKAFVPSFEYGPQGQVAGRPQLIGSCRVGQLSLTTEMSDAGQFTFDLWVASGAITVGVY